MITFEVGPNLVSLFGSIATVIVLYLTQRAGFKKAQEERTAVEQNLASKVEIDSTKKDAALGEIHKLVNDKSEKQDARIIALTETVSSMQKIIADLNTQKDVR